MPMWLWMSNVHPSALQPLPHKLIVKNGDDLRQDMLTLQMLTLFDKVIYTMQHLFHSILLILIMFYRFGKRMD